MKLLLSEWAAKRYTPAPSLFTLRKWARNGEIWPAPEKVGWSWYVDESAQRISSSPDAGLTLVQRMQSRA